MNNRNLETIVSRYKSSKRSVALAIVTALAALVIPGCENDKPTKPEETYFPLGTVVYENRAQHLGSQPDIVISPMSEDRGRKGESKNLTNDPSKDIQPVFSPDGTKVYFSSDRNGDFDLFEIDITDISNVTTRRLTDFEGDETNTTVHPNGTDLFFMIQSPSNLMDDIFKLNIATGDTSMVYEDAGKTIALRYIPQQDNFFILLGQKMFVLDTQTNTRSQYMRDGGSNFSKPVAACDLSKDGLTGYASINSVWNRTTEDYNYDIMKFPFGGTASYGYVRISSHVYVSDWFRGIRDIDGEYFLYSENSPETFYKNRIRVGVPATSRVVDDALTTQVGGNNDNSDYTTREVFPLPPSSSST